ncbi:period circadian protein isoform X3 [Hyposmocoma kahamanoa]|uniref:period circadian protein isoform X3 n=1 Tax=Hyposmocoma kahamanoa TaxID=1477025 RepID=UPI000E6DA258|nr:period circadian protein isoform X3 [Hyposmocoma kahamanoa]
MDNLDDTENHAKVSDSAYSNSCSNSQSRRSHSSKSTHSCSQSSGSSGYGGQPSTSSYSKNTTSQPLEKRSKKKEVKKKKSLHINFEAPTSTECRSLVEEPIAEAANEEVCIVVPPKSSPAQTRIENGPETVELSTLEWRSPNDDVRPCISALLASESHPVSCPADGFFCEISMRDGVVMYTTPSLTTTLGYPKDMWVGRSFIDFVHPRDRKTFASQISSRWTVPKNDNDTVVKAPSLNNTVSMMVCRIRCHRGLNGGFGVKDKQVSYMPCMLKLSFKDIVDKDEKAVSLVIHGTPFFSAFKSPNEVVENATPFVIRHAASGNVQYLDPESMPYLGYLPQDFTDKDALQLYHPEDLMYIRQQYETIVKEGGVSLSKAYRLIAQNGDFVKVETVWSSVVNPWSRKLESVIAKHHTIEGPSNPNVFQSPDPDKGLKLSEDERARVQALKDSIIRLLSGVLTKPAEMAKQHMSKRCQDLVSIMESLMEDKPKIEDQLRLDLQDPDNSYYELESVMLGEISPHHEYSDSKSSTDTPLCYNQLNYSENLKRFFDCQDLFSHDNYHKSTGDNILGHKEKIPRGRCLSPIAQLSGDSYELSSCSSCPVRDSSPDSYSNHKRLRLTESLLMRHNAEMEKELMKVHREIRSTSKGEREKTSNDTRMKKKEHLARCNAKFQPTSATAETGRLKSNKAKRSSKPAESDKMHKHHCSSRRCPRTTATSPVQHSSTITTTVAAHYPMPTVNNLNAFILGIPQQMPIMGPMTSMPGMFPMYYTPAAPIMTPGAELSQNAGNSSAQYPAPVMMYGSPFMYAPVNPAHVAYPMQQNVVAHTMHYSHSTLGLGRSNYEEACKQNVLQKTKSHSGAAWREKMRAETRKQSKYGHRSGDSSCSAITFNRQRNNAIPESSPSHGRKRKRQLGNSDETEDRTDEESSYSSFYSSFFKTDTGSAEDSGDGRKENPKNMNDYYCVQQEKKVTRRKTVPPWMEQVHVTPDLIYKYQILTKEVDEVLKADRLKMAGVDMPSLVNEQLGQLYMDMQLEGAGDRLHIEGGSTASSSSEDESSSVNPKGKKVRRKHNYSKLVMIYEEDAPLPPPDVEPSATEHCGNS